MCVGVTCNEKLIPVIVFWVGAIIFAIADLPNDAKALALISIPVAITPKITIFLMLVIIVASINPQADIKNFQDNGLGNPGAIDVVSNNFRLLLDEEAIYPGLIGFFGWNYEAAVAIDALREFALLEDPVNTSTLEKVDDLLENALTFPHTGAFMKRGWPVFWLYSSGDRIGLFGSLYSEIDETVFDEAIKGTSDWTHLRGHGLKMRNIGYGFLGGLALRKRWIWADDVYMSGAALLKDQETVSETRDMLIGAKSLLIDPETGVFWHGIEVNARHRFGLRVIDENGQKWGRANGWVLLTIARFLVEVEGQDPEIMEFLEEQLRAFMAFQRDTGAFGNLVDISSSPDESSLTSIFIYASGVHFNLTQSVEFTSNATSAFNWLNTRQVEGLAVSDTCGAAPLATEAKVYEQRVDGLQEGPAVGFFLWARIGARLLNLL